MLPKKERANKKMFARENGGKSFFSQNLSLRASPIAEGPRFAFVVSKKVAKSAVERNKLRRRGYESLRPFVKKIKRKMFFVFYFKSSARKLSFTEFSNELAHLVRKVGLVD